MTSTPTFQESNYNMLESPFVDMIDDIDKYFINPRNINHDGLNEYSYSPENMFKRTALTPVLKDITKFSARDIFESTELSQSIIQSTDEELGKVE